uniref:Methyltransferase domain-containing protein n=1 Tax=Octactis speculum TaxID=3111310 RepID=A0A7S2HI05_9STRA|mmetsp:Transcript_64989/g.89297  ORF Transcript_64989/g.89297 Transcript_64989/m.89297 type:complete len:255 (+) Transcript_64989:55-819(+)
MLVRFAITTFATFQSLSPRPIRMMAAFATATSPTEVTAATTATLLDYGAVAKGYAAGNMNHDVSQNIEALLKPLRGGDGDVETRAPPFDILDVCCASGRDLKKFTELGHRAVGLDGVPAFCAMARELSGCEVWQQDLAALDLPAARFDGIFANACLFHLPSAALPGCLAQLKYSLKPGGVLFVSNAHGFGEDREGWTGGRTAATNSYVCWLSEATWVATCEKAGLELLEAFYRPPGKPRAQQPFLATVWRNPAA